MDDAGYIIKLVGDATHLTKTIKSVEELNKRLAINMGKEYANAARIIETTSKKVSSAGVYKKGKEGIARVGTKDIYALGTAYKDVNGDVQKFNVTMATLKTKINEGKPETTALSSSVTTLSKDYSKLSVAQSQLIGKSSQLKTNFNRLGDINQKFSNELQNVGKVSKVVSQNMNSFSGNTQKVGYAVKMADGKFRQLTETTTRMPNGIQKVTRSMSNLKSNTVSLGQNFARLAKRALLTIPIWFAMRQGIGMTVRTFKDGINAIAEFDKVLQKAKRNMQGSTEEIAVNFSKLKKEVLELSLKTGVGVEKITTAFQRFATTGKDFETSMRGAKASTMLAVVQFGDTVQVADSLARAYNVLENVTNNNVKSHADLMKQAALMDELWKTNAFDVGEMGKAMERFAPTAGMLNISMEETVKLMATLHSGALIAQRGGRLLGSSLSKLMSNFDEVQKVLGIKFNPEMDTTVDVLFKVVEAIDKIKDVGKLGDLAETSEVMKEIFNIRQKVPIEALVKMKELMRENFEKTGDIEKFGEAFERVTETTGALVDRFHNANKEIGKAIVSGVVGGDDFDDSLLKIVDTLTKIREEAAMMSVVFKKAAAIPQMLKGFGLSYDKVKENTAKVKKSIEEAEKSAMNFNDKIQKALNRGLDKVEIKNLLKEIEKGKIKLSNIKIGKKGINTLVADLKGQLEELEDLEVGVALKDVDTGKKEMSAKKKLMISEAVLAVNLDNLKASGALTSEVLKAEAGYKKQLGLADTFEDKLDRQLKIEEAITEEKRLQNKMSGDDIKLYDIAKEHGTKMAKIIGDVLSGDKDFANFVRKGGEELEVFKKEFASVFKQQQAEAYFKGDVVPGEKGMRGGRGIEIETEGIRGVTSRAQVALQQARTETRLALIEKIEARRFVVDSIEVKSGLKTPIEPLVKTTKVVEQQSLIQSLSSTGSSMGDSIKNIPSMENAITNADLKNIEYPQRKDTITNADLPVQSKQEVIFKIEFEGKAPMIFEGSKSDYAKWATQQISPEIEKKIASDMDNPQSTVGKGLSKAVLGEAGTTF